MSSLVEAWDCLITIELLATRYKALTPITRGIQSDLCRRCEGILPC